MTNTTYISIQALDYDDYPIGSETKIGPFEDKEAAERYMENHAGFRKSQIFEGYFEWRTTDFMSRHSVKVKDLLNTYMTAPENY